MNNKEHVRKTIVSIFLFDEFPNLIFDIFEKLFIINEKIVSYVFFFIYFHM